jgi:hypothetical protein
MSNMAAMSAHDFISNNAATHKYTADESSAQFETRVRKQYEAQRGVTVDEDCFPVLVMQKNGKPIVWIDCERMEGFETRHRLF